VGANGKDQDLNVLKVLLKLDELFSKVNQQTVANFHYMLFESPYIVLYFPFLYIIK
jgi:hypothetical protein